MDNLNPNQVINGIDGDCWIDDAKMAEVSEFEANIKMTYTTGIISNPESIILSATYTPNANVTNA